jgi:hypothetical protein
VDVERVLGLLASRAVAPDQELLRDEAHRIRDGGIDGGIERGRQLGGRAVPPTAP